jgi:hypothetical protein
MKFSLVLLLAAVAYCQNAPNTLSPAEKRDGWRLLFDGRSLDGWEPRGQSDWKVNNGAMACGGTSPSWIGTAETFSNYNLKLEFRGTAKVNSGVFLRSQKEGEPHITGYELQIWDYQPQGFLTGSLVGTAKASGAKILPDEWNRYEIMANGDHFVIVLNGTKLLDTKDSKHASGIIAFQCQRDNPIEFRNIRVQALKK